MPWLRRDAEFGGHRSIAADDHAGVAERAEVLGREKAEATEFAHGAGCQDCAVGERIFGAERLGGVFDNRELMLGGECEDFVHGAQRPKRWTGMTARSLLPEWERRQRIQRFATEML